MRSILYLVFFIFAAKSTVGQNTEWANKLLYKSVEFQSEWNYPEALLGPPSIYPDENYEATIFDLYADGYILYNNPNKSETIEVGFISPMPANQIVIGGIFNDGVIKKIALILKDNKFKTIFLATESFNKTKNISYKQSFDLETVYGIKLILDHTKINNWNIIKSIGIAKSENPIDIKPDLYNPAEFPNPKDTIGHNINTHECFEFNPRLSSDGSKLYFVKECPTDKNQDIWFAELDSNGKWMDAKSIGQPLNNKDHNFISSVSLDGKTLFVGNTYKPNGEQLGAGISISKWQQNKTWSLPQNVDIPNMENISEYENYFMLHDQSAIVIAMQNKKSIGEMDLYVSFFNKFKKTWSEPMNLGNTINTSFGEDYPYIAYDGVTLYFSSKGHIGYGGYDIYMSKRLDNSWTKWSKPVNLGHNINTKTDDDGFMISNLGDYAYFNTVAFDSVHNMDIYKIKLPKILRQHPQVLIKGKILNSKNGKPVKTELRFKEKNKINGEQTIIKNDDDGSFSFILPQGKEFELVIEGANYFKIVDKISLLDSNVKAKILKNYRIEPYLDSGEVAVMSNILYDFGTANISESSFGELDKMVQKFKQQNKSIIEISGHTDDLGSDAYNLKLSQNRANSVLNYLVEKGIRPWRLKAKGYGEQVPISSNATEEGRTQNRRVEMLILKDDFSKRNQKKQTNIDKNKYKFDDI